MPVEYINRKKEKYYLKTAPSKSGKIQYCAIKNISKINPAELVEEIPPGYEFYEKPKDALVVFRKIPVYNISDEEVEIIDSVMKKHETVSDYIIEKGVDDITIYISQIGDKNYDDDFLFEFRKKIVWTYDDGLKFEKAGRIYKAQRFCYRSSSYGWITMESSKDLRYLAEKYCYHIDKESIYEFGVGW
jgi:hypothetical protein